MLYCWNQVLFNLYYHFSFLVNFHTNCLHSFTVTEYVIGLHAPFSSDTGCHSTDSESRTGSLEVPPRTSPATPRTARKLKTPGSDGDSVSSPHPASRTPKDRSPKIVKSTRSPVSEVFHAKLWPEAFHLHGEPIMSCVLLIIKEYSGLLKSNLILRVHLH